MVTSDVTTIFISTEFENELKNHIQQVTNKD